MKAVISSDWHHDAYTDGVARAPDVEEAVKAAVQHAGAIGADAFIFTGDLTDPNVSRSHAAVGFAMWVAQTLRDMEIDSLWLTGNHDVIEDGSGLSTLVALDEAGFTVFNEPDVMDTGDLTDGLHIMALPFTAASHSYDPDEFVRSVHRQYGDLDRLLVLGHLNMDDMHPGSETKDMPRGRDVMWPLDALSELFPQALLIGGHYHQAQSHKGVQIVGSPVRFTHGEEENEPSFMTVDI
jgi:DNA repair exonuclease SbcCD nuclease subunit